MRNINPFTVSSPQSAIRFRDKERKVILEKRKMKIHSSLSHRRNLESVLDTKGKIILETGKEC